MTLIDRLVQKLSSPAAQGMLIFVAVYTTLWGAWLLAFPVFDSAKLYGWLESVGPENAFGWAAVISGVAMTATILRDRFPFTSYGALIGFVFWGLIATGYYIGDYQNTGGITASSIAGYCAFAYLNIRFNQKKVTDLHLNKDQDSITT